MKGSIKLQNPITKNGTMYDTLRYDTEKVTVGDYIDSVSFDRNMQINMSIQFALAAHPKLGFYAIVREMGNLVVEDLEEQIRGTDIIQIANIGMTFTRGRVDLPEDSSEETSETTQADSARTRSKSEK